MIEFVHWLYIFDLFVWPFGGCNRIDHTIPHVLSKCWRNGKWHRAKLTLVNIFSHLHMDLHMPGNFWALSRSIVTHFTFVGFFSSVWPLMNSQIAAALKNFPTVFTSVILQTSCEIFTPLVASVWTFLLFWYRSCSIRSWKILKRIPVITLKQHYIILFLLLGILEIWIHITISAVLNTMAVVNFANFFDLI